MAVVAAVVAVIVLVVLVVLVEVEVGRSRGKFTRSHVLSLRLANTNPV